MTEIRNNNGGRWNIIFNQAWRQPILRNFIMYSSGGLLIILFSGQIDTFLILVGGCNYVQIGTGDNIETLCKSYPLMWTYFFVGIGTIYGVAVLTYIINRIIESKKLQAKAMSEIAVAIDREASQHTKIIISLDQNIKNQEMQNKHNESINDSLMLISNELEANRKTQDKLQEYLFNKFPIKKTTKAKSRKRVSK